MSIERIKTDGPGSESWKALRKNYIGGSDSAAIMGMNPFSSQYALWAEKVGKIPAFEGNIATKVGSYLEELVAQMWCEETGKTVRRENLSYVNSDYPFAIANIDRKVVGEDAGLEIKTTSALRMKAFRNGEYPENYYCQCMHYLAVTGYKKWYLAVLIGNSEFLTFEIRRDEEEIRALMDTEKAFWNTFVLTGNHPPIDGSDATKEAIEEENDGQPRYSGEISLPGFEVLLSERDALTKNIKVIEERKGEIENQLRQAMGIAENAVCGKYSASWKNQQRTTFDWKTYEKDHPMYDLSAYKKISESRVLRITEKKK